MFFRTRTQRVISTLLLVPGAILAACTAGRSSTQSTDSRPTPRTPSFGGVVELSVPQALEESSPEFQSKLDEYTAMYGAPTEHEVVEGGGVYLFAPGVVLPYGSATEHVYARGSLGDWKLYGPNRQLEEGAVAQAVANGADPGDIRIVKDALGQERVSTWLVDPASAQATADEMTRAARAQNAHPMFTIYYAKGRDCGGASQGGAETFADYEAFNKSVADVLASGPAALVVFEPDLLGFLTQASQCGMLAERDAMLKSMSNAIGLYKKANPDTRIFVSVSNWARNDSEKQQIAEMLDALGVNREGGPDGFAIDVSGDRPLADQVADGEAISALTQTRAPFITESSRSGNGEQGLFDSPTRGIGMPTNGQAMSQHHLGTVHIKNPAERDAGETPIQGCLTEAGAVCFKLARQLVDNTPTRVARDVSLTARGADITFDDGLVLELAPLAK